MAPSRLGSTEQAVEGAGQRVGIAPVVGQQDGRPGPLQHPGVGRLVVAGGPGQRHQDRRHAGHGQLGDGHGPGPAHHDVGRRVDQLHTILVVHPHQRQAPRRRPPPVVPPPPARRRSSQSRRPTMW